LSTLLELAQNGVAVASHTSPDVESAPAVIDTYAFGRRSTKIVGGAGVLRPHMDDLPNPLGESLWEDVAQEGADGHVLGNAEGTAAGEQTRTQMTADLVAVSNIQRY
jgi:hypothetical protein